MSTIIWMMGVRLQEHWENEWVSKDPNMESIVITTMRIRVEIVVCSREEKEGRGRHKGRHGYEDTRETSNTEATVEMARHNEGRVNGISDNGRIGLGEDEMGKTLNDPPLNKKKGDM